MMELNVNINYKGQMKIVLLLLYQETQRIKNGMKAIYLECVDREEKHSKSRAALCYITEIMENIRKKIQNRGIQVNRLGGAPHEEFNRTKIKGKKDDGCDIYEIKV